MSKKTKKTPSNFNTSQTEKKSDFSLLIKLSIASSLVIAAVLINHQFLKPSAIILNGGISGAFSSQTEADTLKPINNQEIITLNQPTLEFETDPLKNSQATISFFFQCKPACSQLWVGPSIKPGFPTVKLLAHHPIFDNLNWFNFRTKDFLVYQKKVQVHDYQSLLADPSLADQILTENLFSQIHPEYPFTHFLENSYTLPDNINYIITNYADQGKLQDWYRFKASFNAQIIDISSGKIHWTISHTVPADTPQPSIQLARLRVE